MPHSVLLFYYYDIIWWNLCVFSICPYMFSCSEQLSPIHGFAQLYLTIFLNLVLVSALRDYLLKSFFSFRYCFIFFYFMCLYAIWKFSYKKILKYFGHAACNVHFAFQIENIRWTAWIYYWIVFFAFVRSFSAYV